MSAIDANLGAATSGAKLDAATKVLLGILLAVVLLGALAVIHGPVVLTLAALSFVPCMFIFFFAVSRP